MTNPEVDQLVDKLDECEKYVVKGKVREYRRLGKELIACLRG